MNPIVRQILRKTLVAFVFISLQCERDDICSPQDTGTPRVILRFYSIANKNVPIPVTNLRVIGLDNTKDAVATKTTDSIALPLKAFEKSTSFYFIENSRFNASGAEVGNVVGINFSYTPIEKFLYRGCGFIANFENLSTSLSDSKTWIKDIEIVNPKVTNEIRAHVKIYL